MLSLASNVDWRDVATVLGLDVVNDTLVVGFGIVCSDSPQMSDCCVCRKALVSCRFRRESTAMRSDPSCTRPVVPAQDDRPYQ